MASRLDLGAVLCGRNPRPGDAPLRDGVDPLRLADGLLSAGFSLDTTEKLLMAYYTRRSEVDERKVVVVEELSSSASSGSTRSKRSEEFFKKCDLWLDKPGYCYTTIVRPSQRLRAASLCGQDATMADLFKLSKNDIAWQRLSEVRVQRVDNWSVHLSFERGSETFVSHMAAFAADFPTMVPQYWREYLSAMIPAQESWFGVTTRFGASPLQAGFSDAAVQDVFAVEQVLYRGCSDDGAFESLFDLEFVCVEPTRVTVPVGARLLDTGAGVIASASKHSVEVLLTGDSKIYVEGVSVSELRARPVDTNDFSWDEMLRDAAVIYDKSSDIGDPVSFSLVSRLSGDGREYDVRTHCVGRSAAVLNEVYSVADRLGYDKVVTQLQAVDSSFILPRDVARMLRVDTASKIEHSVFDGTGICTSDYTGVVMICHDRHFQVARRQFPLARIYSLERIQGKHFDHAILALYDTHAWSGSELRVAFSRHKISLHLVGLRCDLGLYARMGEAGFELPDFS